MTGFQRGLLSTFVLLLCLSTGVQGLAASPEPRQCQVGILAYRSIEATQARWQPLVDYLNQQIPEVHFTLNALHLDELERAVAARELDLVFTQPSHYVLLTYRYGLSSPLATLVNREGPVGIDRFGGVIFARADRVDIQSPSDLPGLRIATVGQGSLGAYQMQLYALKRVGIEINPADVIETGQPQDQAIDLVLRGEADVGFVRTGVLESWIEQGLLEKNTVRVLSLGAPDVFPLAVSTPVYPEWPLAALPNVSVDIIRQVSAALLSLPHSGELADQLAIVGFTVAGDYRDIDQLLQVLRLPPFDQPVPLAWLDVWQRWQITAYVIFALTGLLLLAILLLLWSRNRDLQTAHRQLTGYHQEVKKLTQALEQMPDAVLITDLEAKIEYVNQAFEKRSGYRREAVLGKNPRLLKSGKTATKTYVSLWSHLSAGQSWRGEFFNRTAAGEDYLTTALIVPVRDKHQNVTHYLAIEQDMTEKQAAEARLHQLSFYDLLTGLPNRGLLMDRLEQALLGAHQHEDHAALMLVDIDRFQLVNDLRGVPVGDQLLVAVAKRLEESLPANASIARMGADEFAILMTDLNREKSLASRQILALARHCQSRMRQAFELDGDVYNLTLSFGVCLFPESVDDTSAGLVARSGMALHRAKSAGGNQTTFFEQQIGEQATGSFVVETALRQALQNHSLTLYCQGQFCGQAQSLQGAEVLLRWQDPQLGWVSPADFIPVAEETDLIVDLGAWVIEEACRQLQPLYQRGHSLDVSINISPRHFGKYGFVAWLEALLKRYQIPFTAIKLEITEGLFIHDLDKVVKKMHQLVELGIRFSLDDFGTGYSSLAYIKNLPIQELKIDKTFVQDALKSAADAALVESIMAVGQHMHLGLVAEGVETPAQADYFAHHPQVCLQGFLFERPRPLNEWLSHHFSLPS